MSAITINDPNTLIGKTMGDSNRDCISERLNAYASTPGRHWPV